MTARQSRQWRGLSLDADDDFGAPTAFPDVAAMASRKDGELAFILNWMDHYLQNAKVVGFLAEFREHLERGRESEGGPLLPFL